MTSFPFLIANRKHLTPLTRVALDMCRKGNVFFQIANYRILDANSRFAIDSSTGVLTTSHAFDREASTYIFTITVGAEDGAPSAFKSDGAPNTGNLFAFYFTSVETLMLITYLSKANDLCIFHALSCL